MTQNLVRETQKTETEDTALRHWVKLSDFDKQDQEPDHPACCLSDVPSDRLPRLCRIVHGTTDGRRRCKEVRQHLSDWVVELRKAFVFCCYAGLKTLVQPLNEGKDAYLFFCRSPLCHESHLNETARLVGQRFATIVEAWRELDEFGEEFTERVTHYLAQNDGPHVSGEDRQRIANLGKSYRNYALDILLYDVLRHLSSDRSLPRGTIGINLGSRENDKEPILRIFLSHAGTTDQDRNVGVPIVGLVLQTGEEKSLSGCLNTKKVARLTQKLLGCPVNCSPAREFSGEWRETEASGWAAKVVFYTEQQVANTTPFDDFGKHIETTIDSGMYTTAARLLHVLEQTAEPIRRDEFLTLISDNMWQLPHQTSAGQEDTVFALVFDDIGKCLSKDDWCPGKTEKVLRRIICRIADYHHMALVFRPPAEKERLKSLHRDLQSGGDEYICMLEEIFLPLDLEREKYSEAVVRECLARNSGLTVKAMLTAAYIHQNWETLGGKWGVQWGIDLKAGNGWQVWKPVFDYYRNHEGHANNKELRRITKYLFDIAVPDRERSRIRFRAEVLAAIGKVLSFGVLPSYHVIDAVYDWAYKHYVTDRVNCL